MSSQELVKAFSAVSLAIKEELSHEDGLSPTGVRRKAIQYGRGITTSEHIDIILATINLEVLRAKS